MLAMIRAAFGIARPIGAPVAQAPSRARAVELEEIVNPCALCGSEQGRAMFRVDGSLIVRCPLCDLVRGARRPAAPGLVYDAEYYASDCAKGGYANYVLDASINQLTFTQRLRDIERRVGRKGRLLDVGCALGDFVAAARDAGWDAEGVEISAFAAAEARSRGLTVRTGTLEQLRLPQASYDVVTLYDVIEHLEDPLATLREIRRILKPDGLLHLVTPNVGGLQARLLGRHWYHYKPGEHLVYFSPATLRVAIERTDLAWHGWARSGSYVTVSYIFNRLRYYAPQPFGFLEGIGRTLRVGPFPFQLYVGEMEAWARRPDA